MDACKFHHCLLGPKPHYPNLCPIPKTEKSVSLIALSRIQKCNVILILQTAPFVPKHTQACPNLSHSLIFFPWYFIPYKSREPDDAVLSNLMFLVAISNYMLLSMPLNQT